MPEEPDYEGLLFVGVPLKRYYLHALVRGYAYLGYAVHM